MFKHKKALFVLVTLIIFVSCFLLVDDCFADVKNKDIMDKVLEKYKTASKNWSVVIQKHASYLFVSLSTISLVWTIAQLYFRRSSFTEFFGEVVRFTMFTGLFLWFLNNAPRFAEAIIGSMQTIGSKASGLPDISPSKIVDVGFRILNGTIEGFTTWDFGTEAILTGLVALAVLVILTLVGVNMLLQLCSAWVLAYAGIFFLGFGGSRWTSDMAVNYFKTVLGLGASLMTMTLLVGIGQGIIDECMKSMSQLDPPKIGELNVLLVFSITLLLLTDKLPSMVAGIITGASIGQSLGAGAFGAGAAMGAAMTAMAVGKVGMGAAGAGASGLLKLNAIGKSMGQKGLNSLSQAAQGATSGNDQAQGQASQSSAMSSMGIKPPGGQPKGSPRSE